MTSRETVPMCPVGTPGVRVGMDAIIATSAAGDRRFDRLLTFQKKLMRYCTCELPSWRDGEKAKACLPNR